MKYTPIATSVLAEAATASQMFRMYTEKTAAGQSIISWAMVTLLLLMWFNWYRLFTPEHKIPRYTALLGAAMNFLGLLTVVYFRYWS